MLTRFPGLEERAIIVVTPAEVARRAATILVYIPPVPRLDPELETKKTVRYVLIWRGGGERTICN